MNKLTLSKFMYETVAGNFTNHLPISSVCNARCIFCSNHMNPFPIYREGFRPLADIKKALTFLSPRLYDEIRLSDSLPGRISEGEALLHPQLFEVLKTIREKFPLNTIQMTTNGILLTEAFIKKLIPYKPLLFTLSYHSDNPAYWRKIFHLGLDKYEIAKSAFFHLRKNDFSIQGTIVPLPRFVGYDDIEKTIKFMRCFTVNITLFAPGYSFKVPPALKRTLSADYRQLSSFLITMRKKHKVHLSLLPDLLDPLNFSPGQLMLQSFGKKYKQVLWVFSEAAYEKAKTILSEWNNFVPNEHYACMAKNYTYRGNIICSGLLQVSDYRTAIKKALATLKKKRITCDLVVLPKNSFDRYGDDLKGENCAELSDELKVPIWLG